MFLGGGGRRQAGKLRPNATDLVAELFLSCLARDALVDVDVVPLVVRLIRHGSLMPVVARAQDGPEGRAILDRRFREKYGAVDWWYGVLLRRGAIPLRLDPAPEAP